MKKTIIPFITRMCFCIKFKEYIKYDFKIILNKVKIERIIVCTAN